MKSATFRILHLGLIVVLLWGCGPGPGAPKKDEAPQDPFAPTIVINSGQNYTTSTSATLALSAKDATEMYITQSSTCASGGAWIPYSTSAAWTLANANALNTVYFKVRNSTATSTCVSDTITHDTIAPTLTIINPLTGTYVNYAKRSSFPFQGSCNEHGATIQISGSINDSVLCSFGSFSKKLNLSSITDGPVTLTARITDITGNSSNSSSVSLTKDTVLPTLTLTGPASGTVFNSTTAANVTILGTCSENARIVTLTGTFSDTITCTSGSFSKAYDLTSLSDGNYSLKLNHQDIAGNPATEISATYSKDTVAPTVTIALPAQNGFVNSSNYQAVPIGGTCSENGKSVSVSGSVTGSANCSGGFWSLSKDLTSVADGALTIKATQTDTAGNSTTTANRNFTKDILAPQSPSIEIESGSASTNSSSVTLSLSAIGATQMYITNTAGCASGGSYQTYSTTKTWTLPLSNQSNYVYVKFRDAAGNESSCVSDDIFFNNLLPTLTFTDPTDGTWINTMNASSFTISGACGADGEDVVISGSANATVSCSSGAWSSTFDLTAEMDGTNSVSFTINHQNSGGISATPVTRTFSKDTMAPADISILSPVANPYTASAKTLALSGSCVTGHLVIVNSPEVLSTTCASGTFTLNLSQAADGSYDYTVIQKDEAGNVATGVSFTWVIDSTIPPTPILSSPSPAIIANSTNTIAISGSCVTGNTVEISGDVVSADVTSPLGSLSTTCAANAFSFTVKKLADLTYNFSVIQISSTTDVASAPATVSWTRDTLAPAAVVILNPPTDPYTAGGNFSISGTCESGAQVYLSGSATDNTACTNGAFNFLITKSSDGTYNFSLLQKDAANNSSTSETQQWVRDSSVLPAPVITLPISPSYLSNQSTLEITGTCVSGYTVSLDSGAVGSEIVNPSGSLTQSCINGEFSYSIQKITDGTYTFNFTQTDGVTISPATARTWVLDTTAPTTTLSKNPSDPNYKLTSVFEFSSNDSQASFECNLDSSSWVTCASPLTYATMPNGNHTLEIRAVDLATNADPNPVSYSWSQEANNTIALYHFDAGSDTVDSSIYTGTENNTLTDPASFSSVTGQFSDAVKLSSASSQYLYADDNLSLDTLNEKMTAEFWVKFDSYASTNNQYVILLTKSGASGDFGWEIGMKRVSGSQRLVFRASLDGTSIVERRASSSCFSDTTTWHHIAITFNKGALKFYCDGVAKGSSTIGTAGSSTIFNSTAALRIGRGQSVTSTYQRFNGSLDELRLSQTIRWTTVFTVPTQPHDPD